MRKNKRDRRKRQNGRLRMPWQKKVHRDVKDRQFRFLFEKDMEALLQLYNVLNVYEQYPQKTLAVRALLCYDNYS